MQTAKRIGPAKPQLKYLSRWALVARVRLELERRGLPRLQMSLIVALTGAVGFLSSYALLRMGTDSFAWRYGLSVAIAYVSFLGWLWLWLRTSPSDYDGLDDAISDVINGVPTGKHAGSLSFEGAGGHFGGGGASGAWDAGSNSADATELPGSVDIGESASMIGAHEDGIPLAIVLALLSLLVMILFACLSVIYSAPTLFAEILVDAVLSVSLYRKLRGFDRRHWLGSAVRSTAPSFAIAAVLLIGAGLWMSHLVPEARTLGEVLSAF